MTNLRPRSRAGAGRTIGARRRCPVGCSRTVRSGRTIGGFTGALPDRSTPELLDRNDSLLLAKPLAIFRYYCASK